MRARELKPPVEAPTHPRYNTRMKHISQGDLQNGRTHPADGWYIIEAPGRYPTHIGPRTVTQNLTEPTLAALAAAGLPAEGIPIDRDHLSLRPENATEALGWARELATCNGALAARIEWTPAGLPLIQGKIYKHFSTVYPAPDDPTAADYTPARLIGLALTNQPNNTPGQPPITNTSSFTHNNTTMDTAEIAQTLGLQADATADMILEAIRNLQAALNGAQEEAAEAAEAEAEATVNSECAAAGADLSDEEKEDAKEQLLANRTHGLKYLRLLCANRAAAKVEAPARRYPAPAKPVPAPQNPHIAITNRAKEICAQAAAAGHRITWWAAVAAAKKNA